MSVPILNTGMNQLTITIAAGSPEPNALAVTGARLPADNRDYSMSLSKGGSDRARLNHLLKKSYGVVGTKHVRNAAEAAALAL